MENEITIEGFSELERKLDIPNGVRKITDPYFRPKSFEKWKNGLVYRMLGVKFIQKAVMGTIGKAAREIGADKTPNTYFIGKKPNLESLRSYEFGTRFNETLHLQLAAGFGYIMLDDISNGNYNKLKWDSLAFLFNSFCLMLQRYNRTRVYNAIEGRYQRWLKEGKR